MEWKKPELIYIKTKDLMCKVKVKASSPNDNCLANDYIDRNACSVQTVADTIGPPTDVDPGDCSVLTYCVEVGPLFGCQDGDILACRTDSSPIFR